jgi:ribosomal protein L22
MLISGVEVQKHDLSYDKIIKNTLAQSDELTIRFINGLFGDDIPLDSPVTWLDKESVNDKHTAFIADFYPKIADKMYSIEIEQDDNGDMAVRVFKYTVGGAMLHNMSATDASINITFPQPCVIFLRSSKNTPQNLTWNIDFFDGKQVTLSVPVIRLADLSVKEIAERNLFPVGQFYLRTFEPLTKKNTEKFKEAATSLLTELKRTMENGSLPYHIGVQMHDMIRKTLDNAISKAEREVDLTVTTNIVETLPWIDFGEVFKKLEERGRTERDKEIALKMFGRQKKGISLSSLIQTLRDIGISDEIIETARKQYDGESD